MRKKIDLNKSVYELAKEYPELIDIMANLGFTEIKKKSVLNSVGKIMTVPKGSKMKNIPMSDVIAAFIANGFDIEGEMPGVDESKKPDEPQKSLKSDDSTEKLKSYLRRLSGGEDLESVRADFVREFGDADASDIMKAEQELIKEGVPLSEVQRLCDVHSALFHGKTREEKIANAEKAVEDSLKREKIKQKIAKADSYPKKDYTDKKAMAAKLEEYKGHPLRTLTRENDKLSELLSKFKNTHDLTILRDIRGLSVHYAKKGDLLYPLLKVKYGISGPSDVMWTVDDEIRDEISGLDKETDRNEQWNERLDAVVTRAEEMIYKEKNILFPICAVNFTEDEWKGIYKDSKDYDVCFGVESEIWEDAEKSADDSSFFDGEVVMSGGHMTVEQLTALLNTIPMEITFVDADNINRFFNEGRKVFKRPGMAVDREVFSCHPPKVEPIVRKIIDEFRSGKNDVVPIWMEKGGRTMLVRYMAVRGKNGEYLGTAELVQDMEFAKEHFCKD